MNFARECRPLDFLSLPLLQAVNVMEMVASVDGTETWSDVHYSVTIHVESSDVRSVPELESGSQTDRFSMSLPSLVSSARLGCSLMHLSWRRSAH